MCEVREKWGNDCWVKYHCKVMWALSYTYIMDKRELNGSLKSGDKKRWRGKEREHIGNWEDEEAKRKKRRGNQSGGMWDGSRRGRPSIRFLDLDNTRIFLSLFFIHPFLLSFFDVPSLIQEPIWSFSWENFTFSTSSSDESFQVNFFFFPYRWPEEQNSIIKEWLFITPSS